MGLLYHRRVTAGPVTNTIRQKWSLRAGHAPWRALRLLRILLAASALWFAGAICRAFNWNRTTTALLLLLAVIALATLRDRVLAVIGAIVASFSLEHFFIEHPVTYPLSPVRSVFMFVS